MMTQINSADKQNKHKEKGLKSILKRIFSISIRVSISIILLMFLFRQIDRKSLLEIIKNTDKSFLIFAFFVFFLNYILGLLRWKMLLDAVKIHLPLQRIIVSFAGCLFFSLFLPSTIGGDLVRSVDLAACTKRPREVVATVLLDRLSGYVGLVLVALSAILFGWRFIQDSSVLISITIITAILIAILLVLFNKFLYTKINKLLHSARTPPDAMSYLKDTRVTALDRIIESIRNLHREMHIFRQHKKVVLNNLILSILIQSISPITFYIIALSLGIKINIVYYFIFLPIIGAIALLPISIGGLGLRDATTIFFFAKAGVNKDFAFAMSLLSFFIILVYSGIGGLIYVLTIHHRRIQHYKPSPIHTTS